MGNKKRTKQQQKTKTMGKEAGKPKVPACQSCDKPAEYKVTDETGVFEYHCWDCVCVIYDNDFKKHFQKQQFYYRRL